MLYQGIGCRVSQPTHPVTSLYSVDISLLRLPPCVRRVRCDVVTVADAGQLCGGEKIFSVLLGAAAAAPVFLFIIKQIFPVPLQVTALLQWQIGGHLTTIYTSKDQCRTSLAFYQMSVMKTGENVE